MSIGWETLLELNLQPFKNGLIERVHTGALDWHTPSTNLQEKGDPIVIGDSTGLRFLALRVGLRWLRSE